VKLLVTGGRTFTDEAFVWHALDQIHAKRRITLLIHGCAAGVDSFAANWAKHHGIALDPYPANWTRYDNHAGRVRNCQMLREAQPDMLAAFPGGSGTRHCTRICKEVNLPILHLAKFWNLYKHPGTSHVPNSPR
jgi:hypothetical protein